MALTDWINFHSVSTVIGLVLLGVILYYVHGMMEYQNAATPWPPSSASCPDGWSLDSAGWCVIPAKTACPSSSSSSTPKAWQTTGSLPSAWVATNMVCSVNVGTLHTLDATYGVLRGLVPAVHKPNPAKTDGSFTSTDITPANFSAGIVSIDFRSAPPEMRSKFCEAFGIFWGGVTAGGGATK